MDRVGGKDQMQEGRSIKATLTAVALTMTVFLGATSLARNHAMETEAIGAVLLWFASGAFVIWIALGTSKAFPRVSQGWAAFLVTIILSTMFYRSNRIAGMEFAVMAYGSGLIPAVIASWRALPRGQAMEPEEAVTPQ